MPEIAIKSRPVARKIYESMSPTPLVSPNALDEFVSGSAKPDMTSGNETYIFPASGAVAVFSSPGLAVGGGMSAGRVVQGIDDIVGSNVGFNVLSNGQGYIVLGRSSRAHSAEAANLASSFKAIAGDMLTLGEPYMVEQGADPFEYRSVPRKNRRAIKVTLKFRGRAQPSPFPDE